MSDLLSLLRLGAGGIAAQNAGVSVATNNVANANTRGYTRQRVDLEAVEATNFVGGGVRAGDAQRTASTMLAGRIRAADGSLAMSRTSAEALADVEARLTSSGATIDEQLGNLFSRMSQVAAMPTNTNMRDAAIADARALAAGLRRRSTEAESAQGEANARITDSASRVTSLAKDLAETNRAIGTSADPVLLDRREETARKLSELVGGQARIDPDGQMRFVLDGGAVLVDGIHASALEATPDPTTGLARLAVVDGASRRDVTTQIAGGSMGAELAFRDQTMPGVIAQLDQVAYDVATSFNTIHSANAGLDGVSGRPMFTPLAGVAGAAQAIEVDPLLVADNKRLATAAPGTGPGNNAGALALFGLATAQVASGGTRTLTDAALDVIAGIAMSHADAKADVGRDEIIADRLAGLRDSVSGVDIQEEMTNLARFEKASSAMVKFVSTIDDMLGSLIAQL